MSAIKLNEKKAAENLAALKTDLEKLGAQMFLLQLERQYLNTGFNALDEVLK